MKEKVCKSTLILDQYHGKDYYCDGAVEDELLDIVKQQDPQYALKTMERSGSWPLFYHLNPVREHILRWYPFPHGTRILEIGAGCGAVSGSLCQNDNQVTCIDLSKKRSMINAYRHYDKALEIHVGNFEDIQIQNTFDYVTMIGVLEYGGSYIHTKTPYIDFLKQAKQYLKPDGKLLIAIENKLGLKYFAGCKEDHVGTYFEGIEGYPQTENVRTFSKKELREMLETVGLNDIHFYYPYPDYKFAHTIYSDQHLPKRKDLNDNRRNFDMERLELFHEQRVFDTLIENDMFPEFSNSFFIEAGMKPTEPTIIYTKFSQQNRAQEYQVKTSIEKKEEQLIVKKQAICEHGYAHILHMEQAYQQLSKQYAKTRLSYVPCHIENKEAVFTYAHGSSLEDILNAYAKQGDWKSMIHQIEDYFTVLFAPAYEATLLPFDLRDQMFGEQQHGKQMVLANANIDALFSNVKGNQDYQMFDYEWMMDFEMPIDYIKYRCLFYFMQENENCRNIDLYSLFQLTKAQVEYYCHMEECFQAYVRKEKKTDQQLYTQLGQIAISKEDIIRIAKQEQQRKMMQVYFDYGEGFREQNSVRLPLQELGAYQRLCFACDVSVKHLRIDPMDEYGLVHIVQMYAIDAGRSLCKNLEFKTNGKYIGDGHYLFLTGDPMIEITSSRLSGRQIVLEIQCYPLDESLACWLGKHLHRSWKGRS